MGDITSANAVFTITIPGVFSSPQQLQGFDVDAAISNDAVDVAEDKIGVDGILSAGFIFSLVPMAIHLQADSASNNLFETWLATQKTNLTTYLARAQIVLPGHRQKVRPGQRCPEAPQATVGREPRAAGQDPFPGLAVGQPVERLIHRGKEVRRGPQEGRSAA